MRYWREEESGSSLGAPSPACEFSCLGKNIREFRGRESGCSSYVWPCLRVMGDRDANLAMGDGGCGVWNGAIRLGSGGDVSMLPQRAFEFGGDDHFGEPGVWALWKAYFDG